MDDIKKLLGDDLFAQVQTKLGDNLLFLHAKNQKVVVDDGTLIPKSRFDEVIEQKNTYKTQAETLNTDLTKLKKELKDNEGATTKIQEMQDQIKAKGDEVIVIQKRYALRDALRENNAKHVELLEAKFDLSKIEVGADGKIKDLDKLMTPIKETYKDLFGEKKREGYDPSKGGNTDSDYFTREELKTMDASSAKDPAIRDKVLKSNEYWSKQK